MLKSEWEWSADHFGLAGVGSFNLYLKVFARTPCLLGLFAATPLEV